MKLISWNVNGIRAAHRRGFLGWLEKQNADIVCVQEIKAFPEQLSEDVLHPLGYHSYWHSAKKAGYSGVAIYVKLEPLKLLTGAGAQDIDDEGRILIAAYPNFTVINAYFPNSQPEGARLKFKLNFCSKILELCESLRKEGKNVVLCGDYNIAHKEIDLKNPKQNENNPGFFPEERAWMDTFMDHGYVDTFRYFTKEPGHYTWWSYRPGVRAKNVGWRIDYHCVNPEMTDRLVRSTHQTEIYGSDHCPVALEIRD